MSPAVYLRSALSATIQRKKPRDIDREPGAATRCSCPNPAACLCGDGGLWARRDPVGGAKGYIAAPDAWLGLGGADGGCGRQLVLDPPDPPVRALEPDPSAVDPC